MQSIYSHNKLTHNMSIRFMFIMMGTYKHLAFNKEPVQMQILSLIAKYCFMDASTSTHTLTNSTCSHSIDNLENAARKSYASTRLSAMGTYNIWPYISVCLSPTQSDTKILRSRGSRACNCRARNHYARVF